MRSLMLVLLATLMASGPARSAAGEEPATVVVLFDGSGSMWGKPDDEAKTKLVLARDAVRAGLAKASPEARVGLMSFGHRRGSDCGDVETLLKPEPGSAERINGILDKHNPRGRGPLTNALREAAKELGPQTAPASVVLIHDDPDNCQLDPCQALGDLRRAHPKVVVHVVSIAMKREDSQRMMCLTRPTGGALAEVANAKEAVSAMEGIMRLASYGRAREPAAEAAAKAKGPAAPAAPLGDARPGLQLSASLVAGGDRVEVPLRWRVLPHGQPDAAAVYEADAVAPLVQLSTGRYEVQAQHGFVLVRAAVDVVAGAAKSVEMPLGAGTLRLAAAAPPAGVLKDAVVTFQRTDAAASEQVAMLRGIEPEVALTPGTYIVTVTAGSLRIERRLAIVPGKRVALEPQLDYGEVDLVAVATAGGPPLEAVTYAISEDDPDQPQGRREVLRTAASRPLLSLPAGTYYATARHGSAEARERFVVRAGEREPKILTLASGRIAVAARLPGRLEASEVLAIRLERLDEPKETLQSARPNAQFDVAAGRYRLEARLGSGNVRIEREIDLKAGAREQVVVEPPAGGLRLRLLEQASGTPLPDVAWEIRDRAGRVVWIGSQTEAKPLLLQGRYQVQAETRGRRAVREVEVRAGETRPVDLTP